MGKRGTIAAMTKAFAIELDGATLVGNRWGEGVPTAVLLHCGICDRRGWFATAELLSAEVPSVVSYDRRGFGESSELDGGSSHVDDLIGLLDVIAGQSPVWLVGSSMGGGVALDLAVTAPERVSGLVLFAPSISGSTEPESYDPGTERLGKLIDSALAAGDLDAATRWETWLWLDGPRCTEGRVGSAARSLAQSMTRDALARSTDENSGTGGIEAWSRLSEITVPTTVVCGDLDVPFIVSRSRALAELVANGVYRELSGVAHLPYLEDPALVAAVIAAAIR